MWFRVSGSVFRVPGSDFHVPGSVFRASGSVFRDSGSKFQVSSFEFRVSGFGFRVQGSGFRGKGSGCREYAFGFQVPGLGSGVPGSRFRVPGLEPGPVVPLIPQFSQTPDAVTPLPFSRGPPPPVGHARRDRGGVRPLRRHLQRFLEINAISAQIRQSRPEYGLGLSHFQEKVLKFTLGTRFEG